MPWLSNAEPAGISPFAEPPASKIPMTVHCPPPKRTLFPTVRPNNCSSHSGRPPIRKGRAEHAALDDLDIPAHGEDVGRNPAHLHIRVRARLAQREGRHHHHFRGHQWFAVHPRHSRLSCRIFPESRVTPLIISEVAPARMTMALSYEPEETSVARNPWASESMAINTPTVPAMPSTATMAGVRPQPLHGEVCRQLGMAKKGISPIVVAGVAPAACCLRWHNAGLNRQQRMNRPYTEGANSSQPISFQDASRTRRSVVMLS